MQRDSVPFSLRRGRTLLPAEGLSAMGLNVWPDLCEDFVSPVTAALSSTAFRDVRSLVGNTIHGANLYVVLLLTFCTTVRLQPAVLQKFPSFLEACDECVDKD